MSKSRRLLTIAGAYIAACLVAGAIILAGMLWSPDRETGPIDFALVQITALSLGFVSSLVAVLALPPAAAVSWYAERHGKRSPVFYGGAGALVSLAAVGLFVALLIWRAPSEDRFASMDNATAALAGLAIAMAFFAIAGIAAGLTYWAIAGRTAGSPPATPVAS
jgi:hypothetical protein